MIWKKTNVWIQAKTETFSTQFDLMEDLNVMANLGTKGEFPNNCRRDLLNVLPASEFGEPLSMKLPIKVGPKGLNLFKYVNQSMVLPHMFFRECTMRTSLHGIRGSSHVLRT